MRRAAALLLLAAAACGGGPTGEGRITVLAAASLSDAFTDLGARFEASHPGTTVAFGFGGSSALAAQLEGGAPAHVIATADEATMQPLVAAGLVTAPRVFARNRLALVVAKGNPKGIGSLVDLARPDAAVVLCAEEVPCGRLARQALERAGVRVAARSYEANVNAVMAKVALGEADAGIVYVTDVRAAGDAVEGVDIAADANVTTAYVVATTKERHAAADAFVGFVLSEAGRRVLHDAGFELP